MRLSRFDFHLPKDRIAQKPLSDRTASRLFFYDRSKDHVEHKSFADITDFFGENDVLVLNDSKVLPARIRFDRYEIFLVEPIETKSASKTPLLSRTQVVWKCMVRRGKFFQEGREMIFEDGTNAVVIKVESSGLRHILFTTLHFENFLEKYGEMPTPPYIREKLHEQDRYQTVYAKTPGSVAAPTAGLHFTPKILRQLTQQKVQIEYVTLHVGLGTFLPVQSENIERHEMHSEVFELSEKTAKSLNAAKKAGRKITAVGTTSLRVLESCAKNSSIRAKTGRTDLFLFPPAKFHFVDHLLTNFHLPKSTLLMLIPTFLTPGDTHGIEKMHELYQEAIREKYRFFSFGDAMLIW